MKLYTIITIKDENGCDVKKPIYELSESEVQGYELVGSSAGVNLGHCFCLGNKYAKDFQKRLFGFHIGENKTSKIMNNAFKRLGPFSQQTGVIGVDFYEEK